ncbi:MAG: ParA family protein [Chitinophagales bacterium]|nr:ParA family protein [Hyphomicrobiales bacterium]
MAKMANWIENQLAYKRRVLKALEAGEGGGGGVWLFSPPSRETPIFADSKSSIPIITVGNLKGGVGKSTLVTNLAAGLATIGDAQKKVLIIDLDFQGSLSSMTCLDKEPLDKASALLSGHQSHEWICKDAEQAHSRVNDNPFPVPGVKVVSANNDLARTETHIFVKWLLQETGDIRFNLRRALHHPDVAADYKYIVIDTPPRMTTGHIQALCASTHVLIPTIMDNLSGAAVANYVDQIESHRAIWPRLKYLGVLGTLTRPGMPIEKTTRLIEAKLSALQQKYPSVMPKVFPDELFIKNCAFFARAAGEGIAVADYRNTQDIRDRKEEFSKMVAELESRRSKSEA